MGSKRRWLFFTFFLIFAFYISFLQLNQLATKASHPNNIDTHTNSRHKSNATCNACHTTMQANESKVAGLLPAHRRHFLSVFLNFVSNYVVGGQPVNDTSYGCGKCHQYTVYGGGVGAGMGSGYEGDISYARSNYIGAARKQVDPEFCRQCHGKYPQSRHADVNYAETNPRGCTTCHTAGGPSLPPQTAHGAAYGVSGGSGPLESSTTSGPFAGIWWIDQRYANAKDFCTRCHGELAWFQVEETNPVDDPSESCLNCHNSSPPAGYTLAPDIETLLNKTYNHPVLERINDPKGQRTRVINCLDCHKTPGSTAYADGVNHHLDGTVQKYRGNIRILYPNAEGIYTQWSYVGGSANYQNLQSIDADTTYITTGTASKFHTINLDDTTVTATYPIKKVTVQARARRFGGTSASMQVMIRTGGSDYLDSTTTLSGSYEEYLASWSSNPSTGSSWTVSDINALQAGVKSVSLVGGAAIRVTRIRVFIEYDGDKFLFNGNLTVPRTGIYVSSDFSLCFSCHSESRLVGGVGVYYGDVFTPDWDKWGPGHGSHDYTPASPWTALWPFSVPTIGTNYRNEESGYEGPSTYEWKQNIHWDHLDLNTGAAAAGILKGVVWDSDGNGDSTSSADAALDSRTSCLTCHNPHGTNNVAMTVDALGISWPDNTHGQMTAGEAWKWTSASPKDYACYSCHTSNGGFQWSRTRLPLSAKNLKATVGSGQVTLTWENQTSSWLSGTRTTTIVRRTDRYPKDESDGTVVATVTSSGSTNTYTNTGLTTGITYYYRLFTNYSDYTDIYGTSPRAQITAIPD